MKVALIRYGAPIHREGYSKVYAYPNPNLSNVGVLQSQALALPLKNFFGGKAQKIPIWTSCRRVAQETGSVIKSKYKEVFGQIYPKDKLDSGINIPVDIPGTKKYEGVSFGTERYLYKYDPGWLLEEIQNFEGSDLIIITDIRYVEDFPRHLGLSVLGEEFHFAEGLVFEIGTDWDTVGYEKVSHRTAFVKV